MRQYELMTIHRPDLAEDDVAANVSRIEEYLSGSGAEVIAKDPWGKRRFAYEIDHLTEGYYTVVTFQGETETVSGLDRMLSLADEVVRHKIVRLGDD
jgi:small subunit ribosomal protein S6